jgi:UDP:flavonoid glycosyltransferase YjiC (YdhE family)
LLQSGTPGFEYKRSDLSANIRFVGALLPYSSGGKKETILSEKINAYDKVILVTQGTLEKDPEKIIVPTLEAYKDSDYLVIATTGGSQTQELSARFPQKISLSKILFHSTTLCLTAIFTLRTEDMAASCWV